MDDIHTRTDNIPDDTDRDYATIDEVDQFEAELLEVDRQAKENRPPNEKKQETATPATLSASSQTTSQALRDSTNDNHAKIPKHDQHAKSVPKNVSQEPRPVNGRRPPRKEDLIRSILAAQDKIPGYETKSKTFYTRKKVSELEMILGDMVNRGASKLRGDQSDESDDDEIIDAEKLQKNRSVPTPSSGQSLFFIHVLAARFAESVSIVYEDKLGSNLEGLTQDFYKQQKELEECLGELYGEYGDVIEEYLTPVTKYGMLMLQISSNRFLVNKEKKKQAKAQEDA